MKIGLYDPYLEQLGGGEKVFLTVLEEAIKVRGAEVVLFSEKKPDPKTWKRLNISITPSSFTWVRADDSTITDETADLDLFVVIRGDIPPVSLAKRSVAIIQFPFEYLPFKRKKDFLNPFGSLTRGKRNRQALSTYDRFTVYSEFVKEHLQNRFDVDNISIIGAPVDVPKLKPKRKEPTILGVGRFITHGHHKKQDLMIDAFRALHEQNELEPEWTLRLIGGADDSPETKRYIADLRKRAEGLPVELVINAPYPELVDSYRRASIFWHAAGAEEDAVTFPERLEHFGITTVEAMMYGLVPVVIGRGGQVEIVDDGQTGYLWQTPEELVAHTVKLIDDPKRLGIMGKNAMKGAQRYSKENFVKVVRREILGVV
jgi:glycosyltransferase involved in cell wall biosynthesis